ncbi:hypothetical protein TNCV_1076901 [Trichonephila clavipes]|uniref:Uncharacterized protein n=1 Tax=Trichonephila clavipes TaxID=2585209 RepID=A0A8X6V8U5_TRICX|nr:hypothetical protein TNCV_1076901 [Trichonephila clavipes]
MAPLVQTTRVCICVLRTNSTREAEGDFCGLPMRRDEERVVDPPLVFKKGGLETGGVSWRERTWKESPGWRELEKSAKEK